MVPVGVASLKAGLTAAVTSDGPPAAALPAADGNRRPAASTSAATKKLRNDFIGFSFGVGGARPSGAANVPPDSPCRRC